MKKPNVEQTLVLVQIVDRLSEKLSKETNMLNQVVYLLRVTNVSGNSLGKKYLMDTTKQSTPTNLDISYVENASKTNQD